MTAPAGRPTGPLDERTVRWSIKDGYHREYRDRPRVRPVGGRYFGTHRPVTPAWQVIAPYAPLLLLPLLVVWLAVR